MPIFYLHKIAAFFALVSESFACAFWLFLCWVFSFLSLWLLKWPSFLGPWAEKTVFLIFVAGGLYFLLKGARLFTFPNREDVARKLEEYSHIRHRPLRSIKDRPMQGNNPLWAKHERQRRALLPFIKAPFPAPVLAQKDPYAIRFAVAVFFIFGLIVAGPLRTQNIMDGLFPFQWQKNAVDSKRISLKIVPPDYTRMAPFVFEEHKNKGDIALIPEGSVIKAQIKDPLFTPRLFIDGKEYPFEKADEHNYTQELPLPEGARLRIMEFVFTKADVSYRRIKDEVPILISTEEPEIGKKDADFSIPLKIKEDYGIKTLTLSVEQDNLVKEYPLGAPVTEERTISLWTKDGPTEGTEIAPRYNFASHTWAGLPVRLNISVEDYAGNKAAVTYPMVLPERQFDHPVARELVQMRKDLSFSPVTASPDISLALETLLHFPESFEDDTVAFLAIAAASSRLHYSPSEETARAVISLLWDVALKIEEGNIGLAARDVQQAKEALKKILENPDATEEQIAAAMFDLQKAMQNYFQALHKEMQKRMAQADQPFFFLPTMFTQMMNPDDLADFMQQMESEALEGNRDKAKDMLGRLEEMMDILSPDLAKPLPEDVKMMADAMKILQDLIEQQQALLDDTKQVAGIPDDSKSLPMLEGQDGQGPTDQPSSGSGGDTPGGQSQDNMQGFKTRQDALKFMLEQLMRDTGNLLGQAPDTMSKAQTEMKLSADQLANGQPGSSIPHQDRALKNLKDGGKEISQNLMSRLQSMTGLSFGQTGHGVDPLGRPYGENGKSILDNKTVKLPDEATRKRIEDILNILRDRSGELYRSREERDYYQRLLRRW